MQDVEGTHRDGEARVKPMSDTAPRRRDASLRDDRFTIMMMVMTTMRMMLMAMIITLTLLRDDVTSVCATIELLDATRLLLELELPAGA